MATLSSGAPCTKLFVSSDPKYRISGDFADFVTEVKGDCIHAGTRGDCWFSISDMVIPNSLYNVSEVNNTFRFRVRTSSGSPPTSEDFSFTVMPGEYTASQLADQLTSRCTAKAQEVAGNITITWTHSSVTNKYNCVVANSSGILLADDRWLMENDFEGVRVTNPKSLSTMIGLPYAPDAAMDSFGYLTVLDDTHAKPSVLIRLHSLRLNCPELSNSGVVDEKGAKQTIKKVILDESFGFLVNDTAKNDERDWHPISGTFKQFHWTFVDGPEQNPVSLGAPVSFTVCFSDRQF